MATSGVQSEQAGVATPKPGPPDVAGAARPPGLQAAITLRTPGAVTLAQIAALLAPASRRTVAFALSAADDYKKTDATHRVRLTWTGSLQALVEQLGAIYGLDVCVDDKALRFTIRQRGLAGGAWAHPAS